MLIVNRMNAETNQRLPSDQLRQKRVPAQTCSTAPLIAHTINERSSGERVAGAQIAHRTKTRCVFHASVASRSVRFSSEQPRRRDESVPSLSGFFEVFTSRRDSPARFVL